MTAGNQTLKIVQNAKSDMVDVLQEPRVYSSMQNNLIEQQAQMENDTGAVLSVVL